MLPYHICKQLGLGEPKTTRMCIQLANKTIRYPRLVVEDILVKVKNFFFPMHFVVLDMEEDIKYPNIVGHPFLSTSKELMDIEEGKLILRVGENEFFQIVKHSYFVFGY